MLPIKELKSAASGIAIDGRPSVRAVAISPNGNIAVSHPDGVEIWKGDRIIQNLSLDGPHSIAFAPNGDLVVGCNLRNIYFFKLKDEQYEFNLQFRLNSDFFPLTFLRTGEMIVGFETEIGVFRLTESRTLESFKRDIIKKDGFRPQAVKSLPTGELAVSFVSEVGQVCELAIFQREGKCFTQKLSIDSRAGTSAVQDPEDYLGTWRSNVIISITASSSGELLVGCDSGEVKLLQDDKFVALDDLTAIRREIMDRDLEIKHEIDHGDYLPFGLDTDPDMGLVLAYKHGTILINPNYSLLEWRPNLQRHACFPPTFRAAACAVLCFTLVNQSTQEPLHGSAPLERLPLELICQILKIVSNEYPILSAGFFSSQSRVNQRLLSTAELTSKDSTLNYKS